MQDSGIVNELDGELGRLLFGALDDAASADSSIGKFLAVERIADRANAVGVVNDCIDAAAVDRLIPVNDADNVAFRPSHWLLPLKCLLPYKPLTKDAMKLKHLA